MPDWKRIESKVSRHGNKRKEYDDIIFNEYDEDDLTRLETTLIALVTEYVDAAIEIRKIKEGM